MARGIDGGPFGRDALVRSIWRGWNELRGVSHRYRGGVALGETEWMTACSLAPSTRETEEVKEGNQARRRREGHAP